MSLDKTLASYEREIALGFFMYHLQPELRGRMMKELPVIYNKLVGREIMVSKRKPEERTPEQERALQELLSETLEG